MLYGNDERRKLTTAKYERQTTAGIAKLPGSDSYAYPSKSNPDATRKFDHTVDATTSRFSPLFRYNVADSILSNADFAAKRIELQPTIANLLNPDNADNAALRYAPIDFMHCKYAEAVSGYHMITLRRFAYPVDDRLMNIGAAKDDSMPAMDVGRLVTFTTEEENKLSELMTMSFGLNWRELTANFWTPEVIGNESGASGMLGTLFEFTNPMFRDSKSLGQNAINVDPQHDQNKTYGPVDSITKTHIRDRGLNFNQEINVVFNYDLMSYDGVNPRAAMVDLISNILLVTFNDAVFWGGANKWIGMKRGAYSHYLSEIDALRAGKDFSDTVSYYKSQLESLTNGQHGWSGILELGKTLLKGLEGLALNKIITKLGRPSVMVANSLLSGEPVGEWHLTIGNPFRPIMTIGNLILTNTTMSFGDKLGHDGFPTELKLTCTLKHAKPRSRADIESMFNQGMQRTYWMPTKSQLAKQINGSHAYKNHGNDFYFELTNEIYSFLDSDKMQWAKTACDYTSAAIDKTTERAKAALPAVKSGIRNVTSSIF